LFAGADRVQAQTEFTSSLYDTPTGNWVNSTEAEGILLTQINQITNLLQSLTPGTQAYKTAFRAGVYYKTIYGEVKAGKQIPESIVTGLGIFTTAVHGNAPKSEQLGLRNDAIDMLSQ
jgi:hypothetical protein